MPRMTPGQQYQHEQENVGSKKAKRKRIASGMGGRTSKPAKNQDLSSMSDEMGSNAKKPSKHGMSIGLRF